MARKAEEGRSAAYVAWGTFKNSLDTLAKSGMPNQIDRSVFLGLAGGTQTQLVAAMKFLGLIDEQNSPSAALRELVSQDETERKQVLARVFREAYPDLFALNLKKATPDQFLETLGKSYNVTGSTRRKAASFFLKGAKACDIEVSPFLEKTGKATSTNGARRRRAPKKTGEAGASSPPTPPGTSKTVKLASGGSLTVSADLDLFSLSAGDRSFVFKLIDQLETYEVNSAKAASTQEESGGSDAPSDDDSEGEVL